ncbi:MAG: hypothetical protein IT367_21640, partial [Candidatus Hydrogenedentes bacterium]|nr:hypothetical protein [Candidatus Hydrogenedentota bacterium]
WHPGDGDPAPVAITNSVMNAPDSAQISFAYVGDSAGHSERDVLFLDNSLTNNDGAGVLVAGIDGSTALFERSGRFVASSGIARENLRQIRTALTAYAGDHAGHYPSRLSMLYPSYVADPAVFWNPGDSQPCPPTIDNDKPNTSRSAQISFRYLGADLIVGGDPGAVLVVDGSLSNNGGTGINLLSADGEVDYYAPAPISCEHPPICSAIASANLRAIGAGLLIYAAGNRNAFPGKLSMLYEGGWVADPRTFWNPGDSDAYPLTIDNDVPDGPDSAQISFEYLGPGLGGSNDPGQIVLRDNSAANNAGRGINVLYYDGRTEFVPSVLLTGLAISSGPASVSAGSFAQFRCTATYDDGSTEDVTPFAKWSVASGPGAISDGGIYATH